MIFDRRTLIIGMAKTSRAVAIALRMARWAAGKRR
jgi:hypothetical protein